MWDVSQVALDLIASFEGTRLSLYNDPSGNCTIGIGHLVHPGPCDGSEPAALEAGITPFDAIAILRTDAQKAVDCIINHVTVPLSPNMISALTSFIYNVGCGAFQSSDLLAMLNQGNYAAVPAQLMRWVHGSDGQELPGLVRRRAAEGALFANGMPEGGGGGNVVSLNKNGEVADFWDMSQFGPGHDEFACGPQASAKMAFAGRPGMGASKSAAAATAWGFAEYVRRIGPDTPSDTQGSSIDNMHQFIKDTQAVGATPLVLHYWDIESISPSSDHNHDINQIKAALSRGYGVIATVLERSVYDRTLGRCPYWWNPGANNTFTHILCFSGWKDDGKGGWYFLAQDTANVEQGDGNLQTPKTPQPGPRPYNNSVIISWATIIQFPWQPAIPSGDPLSWPAAPTPPPPVDYLEQACRKQWESTAQLLPPVNGVITPATYNTGICKDWKARVKAGKNPGAPITREYANVDKNGNSTIDQDFGGAHASYRNGVTTFIGPNGSI